MRMCCFGFWCSLMVLKFGFRCADLWEHGGCLLLMLAFGHKWRMLLRSVGGDLDLDSSIFGMASSEADEQIPQHPSVDHML